MIEHAYIGFGSNLGDRNEYLLKASGLLHKRTTVFRMATVVESIPVDGVDGGNFLNTVFECERMGDPQNYMKLLQEIEIVVGGVTEKRGFARTCDLDILLWGEEIINLPKLLIPHPRLQNRDFYLEPLCELIPNERYPGLNETFAELLAGLKSRSVVKTLSTV